MRSPPTPKTERPNSKLQDILIPFVRPAISQVILAEAEKAESEWYPRALRRPVTVRKS